MLGSLPSGTASTAHELFRYAERSTTGLGVLVEDVGVTVVVIVLLTVVVEVA